LDVLSPWALISSQIHL